MSEVVYDTIVVGAGFAGVTAARNLVDQGRSVIVLEAGDRTGGRTYARPFAGREHMTVELGGSWINRDLQPWMRAEVARYGPTLTEDVMPEHPAFITAGRLRSFPVPAAELGDLERLVGHLRELAQRVAPSGRLSSQPLADLDISVEEFLAPLNVGPATRDLLRATVAWYAGAGAHEVSMLGTIVQTAAFGNSPYGFFGALTERFVGGAGRLLDLMIAGSRLDVRLGHHVTEIQQEDDGVLFRTRHGESFRARSCVLAVPTNVIRHIDITPGLSDDKRRHLAQNHPGSLYKPSILVRNIPRRPFALGVGKLQSLCLGYEYDDGTSLIMGFGNRTGIDDPQSIEEVEAAVKEYYPSAEVVAFEVHDWSQDPLFEGTHRVDAPGEGIDFLRVMGQPEDRIVFAGTDVADSVWRTWIEGAMDSAQQATVDVNVILNRGAASTFG